MSRIESNTTPSTPSKRVPIAEFDGCLTRSEAEQLAAKCQGYDNVVAFKSVQQGYLKVKKND